MNGDASPPSHPQFGPEDEAAQRARNVDSLVRMLGWHSVALFDAGTHQDDETVHVNRDTVLVVLVDPSPEFKQFVFIDREFRHASSVLSVNYESVFADRLSEHGEATIHPLAAAECIERGEYGIPQFVGDADPPEAGESE